MLGLPSMPTMSTRAPSARSARICVRDRLGEPPAVGAEDGRVVLLAYGPEAPEPAERELGARHLPDRAVVLAEQRDDGRRHARAAGASVDLRICVEQAVREVADGPHATTGVSA